MPTNTIQKIEDLLPSEVDLLTQLLSLPYPAPTIPWLTDQAHLIARFPPSLLRPSSPLARLAIHLPFTAPCAVLCPTHKPLNPQLVRRIFLQITAECTMRVRRLQHHFNRKKKEEDAMPEVREFLISIQGLNALWMSAKLFHDVYHVASRFERVVSGCEACIIARIGGDRRALVDLRSNVLGRRKKRRPQPRIAAIVEGWIDWSGEGDQIRQASDEVGKEVRHTRKLIQRETRDRRQARKHGAHTDRSRTVSISLPAPAPAPLPNVEEVDDYDEDFGEGQADDDPRFQGSIVSFYRDIVSATNLLDRNTPDAEDPDEIIHPAFRDSVTFLPEQGTFQRRVSSAPHPTRHTFYSQSAYSRDSGFGCSPPAKRNVNRVLSDRQKAYCDLVGIPEDSGVWDAEEMDEEEDSRRTEDTASHITK